MNKTQFNLLPNSVNRLLRHHTNCIFPFTKKDKIIFVGLAGTHGYSILSKETIIRLRELGYSVNYLAYGGIDPVDVNYQSIYEKQFDDKNATCYIINLPPFVIEKICVSFLTNRTKKQKIYAFSLWDSNYINDDYVNQLNTYCDAVIVFSEWNRETFINCGVTKDIYTLKYNPIIPDIKNRDESIEFIKTVSISFGKQSNLSDTVNYYTIGQWTQRKGITETIECFCRTFQNNENVSLILKTHYNGYSEIDINICKSRIQEITNNYPNCPSIYYINSELSNEDVLKIHSAGDVYLSLTKSEGIGLGPLLAANYKKPVIITSYGAQKEYLKNFSNIYFVDYEFIDAQDDLNFGMDLSNQVWAYANIVQASEFCFKQYTKLQEINKNHRELIGETDTHYKHNHLVADSVILDEVTVVLTCHGDRVKFGKKAYKSIIDSGIKNVSIVVSGGDKNYITWAEKLKSKHTVTIIDDINCNNNQCWLTGIKTVKTKWSIILHDDDIMMSSIVDELQYLNDDCAFGIWNGSVIDSKTKKIVGENTVELFGNRSIKSVKLIRDIIFNYPRSISPIHGVFPTYKLIACLSDWERYHGNDETFYIKPTFVVGNDMFIWLYFTQNINDVCFVTPTKCTSCISHEKSATVEDININNEFINLYSYVKSIYIKKSIKSAILLYLPTLESKHLKCLDNLRDYTISSKPIDIIVYSDSDIEIPNEYKCKFIRTPQIPEMTKNVWSVSDKYSYWAFVDGLKIAKDLNLDYFFGYEWDCKVGKDRWYDILWQEHLSWKKEPIITGTPVFKYPFEACGNIYMGSLGYRHQYSKECKLHMVVEHVGPPSLYTNGALTFYDVKKTLKYFDHELNSIINDKSSYVDNTGPWDLSLGIRIFDDLKEKSFDHVGWLPSSYSGCGEYFYTQKQRDYMLNSGMKVVIHQHKYQ